MFDRLRADIKARSAEIYSALGAVDTQQHQRCIFPDHADRTPSFRLNGERWICTCGHGDVFDAVEQVLGLNHTEAMHWASEQISGVNIRLPERPRPIAAPVLPSGYALKLWASANRDDDIVAAHPYAKRKAILHAFGAGRCLISGSVVGEQADCVVVPIRKHGIGDVLSVQAINEEGNKQTFGAMHDGFLLLGDQQNAAAPWFVVEGWATAHAACLALEGSVVLVSFGKGRLQKVADLAAAHFRPENIYILAEGVAT